MEEFEWVPEELLSKWVLGVKSKHEQYGWGSMPGILWDVDTMVFFGMYQGLLSMLGIATKSWRPSFGKRHLRHLLRSYATYYNGARTHLSVNKDAPSPRTVHAVGRIVPTPFLGGLHHLYVRV